MVLGKAKSEKKIFWDGENESTSHIKQVKETNV